MQDLQTSVKMNTLRPPSPSRSCHEAGTLGTRYICMCGPLSLTPHYGLGNSPLDQTLGLRCCKRTTGKSPQGPMQAS